MSAPTRFKPYPAYKDSGVEWLGEIPAHWEVKKVKRLCLVRRGASPRPIDNPIFFDDEGEYAWVRIADVSASERYLEGTTQRLSELGRSKSVTLEPGELFVSIAATVGKPIITKIKCCIHDGFVYFVGLREDREYLFYLFSCGEAYKGLGKLGTQLNLNTDTIGDIYLPLPPQDEQRAIASFLDQETARIDALAAKKERLIELLQEKRIALITRAVTKGLDPTVPMKDSGVEWLGEIPAHWEVKRLKNVVPGITVGIVVTPSKYYVEDGVPCLRSLNIAQSIVTMADIVFISPSANELHRKSKIFAGDVLVVRTGKAGAAVVVPKELDGSNCIDLLIIRRSKIMDSRFLYHFINSLATLRQVEARSVGAIQEHFNTGTLSELWLPRMPIHEQRAIAAFLDRETARIDSLIAKVREAIDRLKELRTALVSAAVTGKINVREEDAA